MANETTYHAETSDDRIDASDEIDDVDDSGNEQMDDEENCKGTPLHPDVDIENIPMNDAELMMATYRTYLSKADLNIRKILRKADRSEEDDEELLVIREYMDAIQTSMQLLNRVRNVSIFDYPSLAPAPKIVAAQPLKEAASATPVAPSTSTSSGKRPMPSSDEDSDVEDNGVWQKPNKKHTAKKGKNNNNKAVEKNNVNKKENIPIDVDPSGKDIGEEINAGASTSQDNNSEKIKKPRVPPFYLNPPSHWQTLIITVRQKAPSCRSKLQGKYLRVNVDTEKEHRELTKYFIDEKVQFKSYLLEEQKPIKCVIRGLPINTQTSQIKEELEFEGFQGLTVTQMYRGPSTKRVYMPLFHVQLPKQIEVERIFQITDFMGTEVQFEIYRGKKGPSQCHNCQGFFHSASACNLRPRCVKCAEFHRSADCGKPFEAPCKCAQCGGDHPANYRLCPKFPKSKPSQNKNNSNSNTKSKGKYNWYTSDSNRNSQNTKNDQNQKDSKQQNRDQNQKSNNTFSSKKTDASRSYAGVTAPRSEARAPLPINSQNYSAPADANSEAEFLKYILILEDKYSSLLVLRAFKQALPAIRSASTEMDRIYCLYESVVTLSSSSG